MNNLHRELAPISDEAWADLEAEARRTFERHVAARRVVDVEGPAGPTLAAVGTGHLSEIEPLGDSVLTRLRAAQHLVELRVPFSVDRVAVDDVARGAKDPDWQPVKEAAKRMAFAEDRLVFEGHAPAGVLGIRESSDNDTIVLPGEPQGYPNAVGKALTALRLAGVGGPYTLLLGADSYTAVTEASEHGYPIYSHIQRMLDGEIVWAPSLDGAILLSTRGGDYALHFGQDLSIGYLSHDAAAVELYFQESLTFAPYTAEASVIFTS
jgi:uncharacterized linocin/CFP29 family protein